MIKKMNLDFLVIIIKDRIKDFFIKNLNFAVSHSGCFIYQINERNQPLINEFLCCLNAVMILLQHFINNQLYFIVYFQTILTLFNLILLNLIRWSLSKLHDVQRKMRRYPKNLIIKQLNLAIRFHVYSIISSLIITLLWRLLQANML